MFKKKKQNRYKTEFNRSAFGSYLKTILYAAVLGVASFSSVAEGKDVDGSMSSEEYLSIHGLSDLNKGLSGKKIKVFEDSEMANSLGSPLAWIENHCEIHMDWEDKNLNEMLAIFLKVPESFFEVKNVSSQSILTSVFLHEVGHCSHQKVVKKDIDVLKKELEADRFMIKKMRSAGQDDLLLLWKHLRSVRAMVETDNSHVTGLFVDQYLNNGSEKFSVRSIFDANVKARVKLKELKEIHGIEQAQSSEQLYLNNYQIAAFAIDELKQEGERDAARVLELYREGMETLMPSFLEKNMVYERPKKNQKSRPSKGLSS